MSERRKTAEYPVSDFISAGTGSILYAAVRLILYGITYWKGSHEYKGLQKYVSEQPKDEISTEENGEFTVDFPD